MTYCRSQAAPEGSIKAEARSFKITWKAAANVHVIFLPEIWRVS